MPTVHLRPVPCDRIQYAGYFLFYAADFGSVRLRHNIEVKTCDVPVSERFCKFDCDIQQFAKPIELIIRSLSFQNRLDVYNPLRIEFYPS